jgi:hypothetical protein
MIAHLGFNSEINCFPLGAAISTWDAVSLLVGE